METVKNGPINAFCKEKPRPLISGTILPQYSRWHMNNFKLKINSANNCVKLKSG